MKSLIKIIAIGSIALLTGCTRVGNVLNPFYETPSEVARLGERSDRALHESQSKSENARQALESMASYQRASSPQPNNPVLQPAVARLMWIPDHLNRNGDLVPAHYYYLKVLKDRWAVQDAFELEAQLGSSPGASGAAAGMPFVIDGR